MDVKKVLPLALGLLLTLTAAASETQPDRQGIEHVLRTTWERPGALMQIDPVTIVESYAIAGWSQGEHAGRALLQYSPKGWRVIICAGDALLDIDSLRDAGLSADQAKALLNATQKAEQQIEPARREAFARFNGVVRMP